MFRHIRHATNPTNISSGIQQVNVPRPRESVTIPHYSHTVLQETSLQDIVWETILEPSAIEEHLLRYNRQSFRAAAASPCGHGIIHDTLTFTSVRQSTPRGNNSEFMEPSTGSTQIIPLIIRHARPCAHHNKCYHRGPNQIRFQKLA